jgi:hypothetical protein
MPCALAGVSLRQNKEKIKKDTYSIRLGIIELPRAEIAQVKTDLAAK